MLRVLRDERPGTEGSHAELRAQPARTPHPTDKEGPHPKSLTQGREANLTQSPSKTPLCQITEGTRHRSLWRVRKTLTFKRSPGSLPDTVCSAREGWPDSPVRDS